MADILNEWVLTDRLATSGQPRAEQFPSIAERGYHTVINLALPDSDGAIDTEAAIVSRLSMNYIHLPVPFDRPTRDHLHRFCALLDACPTDRVWIHCALNMRVSVFVYCYLTQRGVPPDQATTPMLANWQASMPEVWRRLITGDAVP